MTDEQIIGNCALALIVIFAIFGAFKIAELINDFIEERRKKNGEDIDSFK